MLFEHLQPYGLNCVPQRTIWLVLHDLGQIIPSSDYNYFLLENQTKMTFEGFIS